MNCPKCRHDNPPESDYCGKCGARIMADSPPPSLTATLELSAHELSSGSLFAGRYQVFEELGHGGMGRVYKVLDKEIGEKIALKLLNPEIAADGRTIERFRNELKTARQVSHKNVCRMYHLGMEEGAPYITMEYVRGEDLKSVIRMMGRLSPGQALAIADQICEGLAEAHRLGVIHRDLKPQNIMIDREGSVKIMDFGIARSHKTKGLTGAGVMIGTPEYMAPEQVEGKETGEAADIYALGVILFEMLTGRVPFEGDTALAVALKQKTDPPPDPRAFNPQIPGDLGRVVLRCLEKEAAKRYAKAEDLRADLTGIGKDVPAADKVLPKGKPITSKELTVAARKGWKAAAALAAVAVIAISAVLLFRPDKPAPPSGAKRLAVLPFENLGPPEDEYFADGITDEIIARLTGVGGLGVIARTSSMQYKKTGKPLEQVGRELGVEFIVSGTIRWQKAADGAGRVRVTPTLIRAGNATQIWAHVYEEPIAEIFQVQSDISKYVIEALGIALGGAEQRSIEARPTANLEAYDNYLRGYDLFYSGRDLEQTNRLAIEMFEKAVSLDPAFLQAYALLALMHANYYWFYFDHSLERVAKAKEAADKAYRLNPEAPEAHWALGYFYYHCKLDYDQALNHFQMARRKQPNNSGPLEGIAYVKRRQGKLEETAEYLLSAFELDPRSSKIASELGETYALLRKFSEAERFYDRALSLQIQYDRAYSWKARLFIHQGKLKEAREVLEYASRILGRVDPDLVLYHWVLVDLYEGNHKEALARLSSEPSASFSRHLYFVPKASLAARAYGLANDRPMEKSSYEAAVELLNRAIEKDPEDSRYYSALGIALAGLGKRDEAIRAAKKATDLLPISKEAYCGSCRAMELAQVYAMVGEYDAAFDLIEQLLAIPGEMSIPLLRTDPVWTPLRSLPRFQKLVAKFR